MEEAERIGEAHRSFNLNLLECKLRYADGANARGQRFNLNLLECK